MAGSSRDYWIKREREAKKATIRDQEAYKKSIEDIYNRTYEAVERQINDWYAKYASKHGLTMAEARARVKKLDMERYERLAAKYVATHDFSDQANEEMEIYNLTMRINRLELLKAQINLELLAGYDDLDHEMQRQLIEQAMKEDRRLAGILGDSVIGNLEYAKQLVNASFQNATFSERIWGNNMPKLRSHIETELRNGIIQGIHPRELARRLRKSFDVSIADSERLMVTETRRIQTDIQKASFERNGFTEYRFITTGDERVCPDCEALHEQHFKVSEMQPGENAPPMHPMCRCSTAAYMDGEKYKRWLEALERGEDVRWRDFEAENSDLVMQKAGKSGILTPKDIAMSQDIRNATSHEDIIGILKRLGCVNTEGLEDIPLESVKYFAAGMQRAEELFGRQYITKLIVQKGMRDYGDYNPLPPTIRVGRKKAEDEPLETYFTALHESAHNFDHSRSSGTDKNTAYDYSTRVVKQALSNLGISKKKADRLIYEIDYRHKPNSDFSEVFAKAIEYGEAKVGNQLAKEIYRMVKEGELP